MKKEIDSIIFDLGGVLIDWNPDYVYLNEFKGDEKKNELVLSKYMYNGLERKSRRRVSN